jgi:hypothetical protein
MSPWELCSVAIGADTALPPGRSQPALRVPPARWAPARRAAYAGSHALTADDRAALEAVLAATVDVAGIDASDRVRSRDEAIDGLLAWRREWHSCEVLLTELLLSGRLFAATGLVVGIRRDGHPSCSDVRMIWRAGR